MMKSKLIVGNLKMHLAQKEQRKEYIEAFNAACADASDELRASMVVCPPTLFIGEFHSLCAPQKISLGAQDCFWKTEGKFTGETSPEALVSYDVRHVILGHSERRALGEKDDIIAKKAQAVVDAGIVPIVCVGYVYEDCDEKESVQRQIVALKNVIGKNCTNMIVAYEPVWAIGSGKTPTKKQIDDMAQFIRTCAQHQHLRVLYGGSVVAQNVQELCGGDIINGVLVGGASLQPEEFVSIAKNAMQ